MWCFDNERPRAADLKDELQTIWAGKLESVIWRPVGPFASPEGIRVAVVRSGREWRTLG